MSSIWLSDLDTIEVTTPVSQKIMHAISQGNREKAALHSSDLREERIILHDFFADVCTALFTWIGRHLGEETLQDMFRYCFLLSAKRQIYDLLSLGIDPGLETLMLARNAWIAHSCSGAGEHGGSFRLTEDDEKFTFILDPCGSGGRLWRRGRYEPPWNFATTSRAYPWSYGRKDFPYYCIHCAFLNELLPYEYIGYPSWPVDPPEHPMDICMWHIYKDRWAVPERYYSRYGIARKEKHRHRTIAGKRWFSDEYLGELRRPTPERIRERIQNGDMRGARRICGEMAGEFLFLHNLYVNMIAATLEFIVERKGEGQLGEVLTYLYETCVKEQIVAQAETLPPPQALTFLIHNLFLADTCGGSGLSPARIRIIEDPDTLFIILDPCGSGGKLIRHGAYTQKGGTTLRESLENRLLKTGIRLRPPQSVLEITMPYAVTYFTETRKPTGLHTTGHGYEWSSGRSGVPYYCCICTSSVRRAGCRWLTVSPPEDERQPCIWRVDKKKI
ncbi:MAG: hypothetical protein ACP5G0_05025 [Desulfomonilia bacterium]